MMRKTILLTFFASNFAAAAALAAGPPISSSSSSSGGSSPALASAAANVLRRDVRNLKTMAPSRMKKILYRAGKTTSMGLYDFDDERKPDIGEDATRLAALR